LGKIHRSARPLEIALSSAIDHVETYVQSSPRLHQAKVGPQPTKDE
jgi:hypothetical protein